jgi:DNA-binding FadR family transcriptional regulator
VADLSTKRRKQSTKGRKQSAGRGIQRIDAQKETSDQSPQHVRSPRIRDDAPNHSYLRLAERIRLRILSGELKPGDRLLNEIELARKEGVGRTTLREALRLLASGGLIETRRGVQGGAFITHPNVRDLDDLMTTTLSLMQMYGKLRDDEIGEASRCIMATGARLATLRGSDEEGANLVALALSLRDVKDDDEWVRVGRTFNLQVIHMTRNRLLAIFMQPLLWIGGARYKERRQAPGWREATAIRYGELADAIKRRAPAAAEEAMVRIIEDHHP